MLINGEMGGDSFESRPSIEVALNIISWLIDRLSRSRSTVKCQV